MSDLSIEQAIAEMRDLVRCRCHPAFTERKLHDPDCNCDSAEAVEVLANALPAVQPKVKPLVWEESLKDRWIGTPDSKLGDLAFWIFRHHDGTLKRATKEGWQFYPTLDAAQAAAQADYAARILAALKGESHE